MDRHHSLHQSAAAVTNNGVDRITCILTLMILGLLVIFAIHTVVRRASKVAVQGSGCCGGHTCTKKIDQPTDHKNRFSLANARSFVKAIDAVPEDIKKYKFDTTQTTGVHTDWNTNKSAFGKMCSMLTDGLAYVIHHGGLFGTAADREAVNNARLVIAVTENFINRFQDKIDTVTKSWGSGCVTPVCDITAVLAHYLLLEQSASMKDAVVDMILNLIKSPTMTLNVVASDRVQIVRLAAPWIMAMYLKGDVETAEASSGYKTATDNVKIQVRHKKSDTGTHMDHSYHNGNRVDFDYLARLCDPKITFFYGFDGKLLNTPLSEWTVVKNIIMHPTVKCGNSGILGISNVLSCDANVSSEYGIKVMPFSGYIRYFTKDWQFSVRAQKEHLAFYVANDAVNDMAQYWVQYRNVHHAKILSAAKFPDVGFISKTSQNALTKLSLPTGTDVKEFMPTKVSKSFVAAYKHFGVMYQEYEISEFGKFNVTELIVMNTTAQTVQVMVKITNNETVELTYYGAKLVKNAIPASATKSFVTNMSMANGAVETKELTTFPSFPYTLETGIVVKDVAELKSYLVFDDGVPVVWIPNGWTYELPTLVYNLDDKPVIFTFDTRVNQYVNVNCHA